MQIHTETQKIGEVVYSHKVCNGTHFNRETPDAVVHALAGLVHTRTRVRIFCGELSTGLAWTEEHNNMGTIGRSNGRFKSPLMIANARSMGGPALLDSCILAIRTTGRKPRWLYKADKFDLGSWESGDCQSEAGYLGEVRHNGDLYARTKTRAAANRLAQYMAGWRDAK